MYVTQSTRVQKPTVLSCLSLIRYLSIKIQYKTQQGLYKALIELEYDSEFEKGNKLNSIFDEILYSLKDDEIALKSLNFRIDDILGDYMPKNGFVYVIYVGQNLYKICATTDIGRRVKELQESRIVRVLKTERPFELENKLHNRFNQRRLTPGQELFKLNDEDLAYIHLLLDEDVSDSYSIF